MWARPELNLISINPRCPSKELLLIGARHWAGVIPAQLDLARIYGRRYCGQLHTTKVKSPTTT